VSKLIERRVARNLDLVLDQGAQARRRLEAAQVFGELDVARVGEGADCDLRPPTACRGDPLQGLPGRGRPAALVAGDRRLRGSGESRKRPPTV
jgi:hypothetical protein